MPPARRPFNGTEKKLVLALDIGTTFSGISYSVLDPGHIPEIRSVTRYPAQEKVGGDSKIPTIIYYDQAGDVRAVGAEALLERIQEQAEDDGWVKASWFKIHMRPKSISNSFVTPNFLALPPNKSVIDLFADFMKYLYECAKTYIEETSTNGPSLWKSVQPTIEYVLTHPNGWEGPQQQHMRQAAVLAGLVPDTPLGHGRVRFVTEGEASLHFCVQKGLTIEPAENGEGVVVVDAGGGTIDISAYGRSSETKFEEIAAAECHLQGSVFVTERARAFLSSYLKDSKFLEDVERMAADFDQSAKLTFDKVDNPLFIRFGGARDRDPDLGIRGGQLKLPGTEVAKCFQPSIACIIDAIQAMIIGQETKPGKRITTVFLVGGFSASQYLFAQVKAGLELNGIHVFRPDCHLNKAVSEGAMSFYLDCSVDSRISKFAYGISSAELYDRSSLSHRERASSVISDYDGTQFVPNHFSVILPKGKKTSEKQEFAGSYYSSYSERSEFEELSSTIIVYRGSDSKPEWLDIDADQYTTLCHVESADISQLRNALIACSHNGHDFFRIDYSVIVLFGLTELAAQIEWEENGVKKRGAAKIIYDELN